MTADFAPLLRAIVESPDDDTIRLIAADFLDENGEPERAAFIRCQVQLAAHQATHPPLRALQHCQACASLRRREQELLPLAYSHVWGWLSLVDRSPEVYRRGFVAQVTLSWFGWLTHHEAILESCPIRNARDGLVVLTTWPEFAGDGETLYRLNGEWSGVHFELMATTGAVGGLTFR